MYQQQPRQEQEQATSGLDVDYMADSKKYDGSQWEHSLRKLTTATADIEPTIYTDGTAITSYTIKGNTVQNGTPTPSNPVDVNGVGEKTANLFNYKVATYGTQTNSNGTTISAGYAARSASLNAETVTVSCNGETKPYSYSIVWLDGNDTFFLGYAYQRLQVIEPVAERINPRQPLLGAFLGPVDAEYRLQQRKALAQHALAD